MLLGKIAKIKLVAKYDQFLSLEKTEVSLMTHLSFSSSSAISLSYFACSASYSF